MANLPLKPPIEPQLARSRAGLPLGEQWTYEPKYDGFRAIVFVDGDELCSSRAAPSRSGATSRSCVPRRPVRGRRRDRDRRREGQQDFGALQQRIHPAASRIAMLAEQTPAHFVAFDLLALDDDR